MTVIAARTILNSPREAVWQLKEPHYEVAFEDGVTRAVRSNHLIFNRYCWELFLVYPDTPIANFCDVGHLIGDGHYDADTHRLFLERIYQYIVQHNRLVTFVQKEQLLKCTFKIIDYIQNEIVENISDHVATLDAVDLVKVVKDPVIQEVHSSLRPTPESVDRAYKQYKVYTQTADKTNRFVAAYRHKSINDNQANQCIGPRGFISGRDLTVYMLPVQSGFIRGMQSLYEMLVESLTAQKSLAANESSIKDSEYTSRRIQLLTMYVKYMVAGDCGSTEYMDILVSQGLLGSLKGTHYLQEDGSLCVINGTETHLVDKLIKVRTALGCRHADSSCICATCLGDLAHNFQPNTNLGYVMTAYLMEKFTQTILSTKHLTHSVKKSLIQLFGATAKYLYTNDEGELYFHPDVDMTGLQIILPNNKLNKLVDVLNLPHTNINFNKVGELDEAFIRDTKQKSPMPERMTLAYRDRNCIITKDLLEHMKRVNLETDSRTNFIVPLDDWDKSKPIFVSPLKEANLLNFVNQISAIIEKQGEKIYDPYEKLMRVFNLVHEKFKVNFAVLQVLVYATTTFNKPAGNYRLGRNSQYPYSEKATNLINYRDFPTFAAYERQMGPLLEEPMNIFGKGYRQPHPIGVCFSPQDYVGKL